MREERLDADLRLDVLHAARLRDVHSERTKEHRLDVPALAQVLVFHVAQTDYYDYYLTPSGTLLATPQALTVAR